VHESAESRSSSGLRWVLSAVASVTLIFGVLAYKRFVESSAIVRDALVTMEKVGAEVDAHACVDEVVKWHKECGARGGDDAVCLQAVKLTMFHCLAAKPREEECKLYEVPQRDTHGKIDPGDWVFMRCIDRGLACKNTKDCACAQAFRSLESFCVSGQKAVQI
jgi:hypothetical protein